MKGVVMMKRLSSRGIVELMRAAAVAALVGGCLTYADEIVIEPRENSDLCEEHDHCKSGYCSLTGRCWDKKPEGETKLWYGEWCGHHTYDKRCAAGFYCNELNRCAEESDKTRANTSQCDPKASPKQCAKYAVCATARIGWYIPRCYPMPRPESADTKEKERRCQDRTEKKKKKKEPTASKSPAAKPVVIGKIWSYPSCRGDEQCPFSYNESDEPRCIGQNLSSSMNCRRPDKDPGSCEAKAGDKCILTKECPADHYCGVSRTKDETARICLKVEEPDTKRSWGSSCTDTAQCDTNKVTWEDEEKKIETIEVACAQIGDVRRCYEKQDAGETCHIAEQCKSGYCNHASQCEEAPTLPWLRPDHASCTDNAECYSDKCAPSPWYLRNMCHPE